MEAPRHDAECKCMACRDGWEAFQKHQDEMLEKHGWVVHYVIDHGIHTHGLAENFDHPDLEITLPADPKILHPVFSGIVEQIKDGKKFSDGEISDTVLSGDYKALFVEAQEGNRTVLRIILPDSDGNLEQEKMVPCYAEQYLRRWKSDEPSEN